MFSHLTIAGNIQNLCKIGLNFVLPFLQMFQVHFNKNLTQSENEKLQETRTAIAVI